MLPFCVVPLVHGFIITGSCSISPKIPTLSGSFNIQALLQAIILDAETPQAQGLGDELLVYVAKYVPEATLTVPRNALDLLMMVLKTCCVHFERFVLWSNAPSIFSYLL